MDYLYTTPVGKTPTNSRFYGLFVHNRPKGGNLPCNLDKNCQDTSRQNLTYKLSSAVEVSRCTPRHTSAHIRPPTHVCTSLHICTRRPAHLLAHAHNCLHICTSAHVRGSAHLHTSTPAHLHIVTGCDTPHEGTPARPGGEPSHQPSRQGTEPRSAPPSSPRSAPPRHLVTRCPSPSAHLGTRCPSPASLRGTENAPAQPVTNRHQLRNAHQRHRGTEPRDTQHTRPARPEEHPATLHERPTCSKIPLFFARAYICINIGERPPNKKIHKKEKFFCNFFVYINICTIFEVLKPNSGKKEMTTAQRCGIFFTHI